MDSSASKIHKPLLLDIRLIYLICEEKEKRAPGFQSRPPKAERSQNRCIKKKKNPYTAPLTACIPRDKIKHLKRAQIKSFHVTF